MSEYNPNLYPNLDCPLETATETDEELFNNLFDEDVIHRENECKKYMYFITFLGLNTLIGYMYYIYICSN